MRRPAWLAERLLALHSLTALRDVPDAKLTVVAQELEDVTVEAGTVITRSGEPVAQLAIVLDGALSSIRGTLGPGATVGWPEMWRRDLAREYVVASERTRLLVLGRAGFRTVRALDLARHGNHLRQAEVQAAEDGGSHRAVTRDRDPRRRPWAGWNRS